MREGRSAMLGGVAAGFAEYLEVDPVLVRLGFVLLAFVNGLGVLFYLVCWLVMPRREAVVPPLPSTAGAAASSAFDEARAAGERLAAEVRAASPDAASAQLGVGSLLVIVGALLLGHNLDWFHWPHWLRFDTLWPLLLVALGVGLIAKSRKPASA
jgi:phage shock protein PspC (stress-responsive transcriptional regulator)